MKTFNVNKDKLKYTFEYNPEETQVLRKTFSGIRKNKALSEDILRRTALWKIDRVLNVPESLIKKLDALSKKKKLTIHDAEVKVILQELIACEGVGVPMASAFLKFLRPDVFPIIDVRAYRAIFGKKLYYAQHSIDKYYRYVEEIYKIRDATGLPLAEIDERLYAFDKEKNGKI